jgi:hypothetical protein
LADRGLYRPELAAPLRRTLSLWQVTLSGIGVILGAGAYALIGPAAAQAGNALWLSFLLAGLTAGLTAYAYARLARLGMILWAGVEQSVAVAIVLTGLEALAPSDVRRAPRSACARVLRHGSSPDTPRR